MRPFPRPPCPKQKPLLPRAIPQTLVPRRLATTSARNAAATATPKIVITPGSQHHNSLPSFIEYAERTKLEPSSTVYVGTHYEYVAALALQRLGFSLIRVGRSSDAGIDLIGHWVLAPLREPLPIIIQCKARQDTPSPAQVRELEGSFQGMPPSWQNKAVLGLLVTPKKATKGVLEAMGRSHWPMGFLMISLDGLVQQFLWNRAASERGLEGVSVTVRHTPRAHLSQREHSTDEDRGAGMKKKKSARFQNTGTDKDIQLTWMGSPIFPDRGDMLAGETVKLMSDVASKTTAAPPKQKKKKTIPPTPTQELNAQTLEPEHDTTRQPPTLHTEPADEVDPRLLCTNPSPRDAAPEPRKRGRPPGALNKVPARGPSRRAKTALTDGVDAD